MTNDSSKPAIPEWQRKSAPTSTTNDRVNSADKRVDEDNSIEDTQSDSDPQTPSSDDSSSNDRSALLEQAKTFLSDPEIRDATTSRKVEFLESKGLTNDEIDSLLEDASSVAKPNDISEHTETVENETHTASAAASSTVAPSTSNSSSPRDVPPIITYPEFLVNSSAQDKPPLLSLSSVLYTLYGAAGLGATFYGASEFLVKPMLQTLGEARHELAETALGNLTTLNEKLEKSVSKIPPHIPLFEKLGEDLEADETESITSDPTEVFHRDIATQTSPRLMNEDSSPFPNSPEEEAAGKSAAESHSKNLSRITSHLQELVSDNTKSSEIDESMRERISSLQSYLDGLNYSSSYSPFLNNSIIYNSNYNTSSGDTSGSGTRSKEEDAVSAFRAEIRGVKGALLSARNFPAGRPAGAAR